MAIDASATEAAKSLCVIKPVAVLTGVRSFTLTHPMLMLGLVGGSLILLGLSDTVRGRRAKKPAAASPVTPDQP